MLIQLLSELKEKFANEAQIVKEKLTKNSVEELRIAWLGKKGHLGEIFQKLKDVPKEQKPLVGKLVNELRIELESVLTELQSQCHAQELKEKLESRQIDVTLPVNQGFEFGSLHPVTLVRRKMIQIFHRHGFSVYDGPEIDNDFYNFSALNIPQNHPAREMQDTFFVKNISNYVLRTQTSNVQIHAMLREKPPLRLISPGKVYRVDNDATHSPMFHQMECVVVDKNISFANLKGMIKSFIDEIFGTGLKTRFRPSYFPFVEPGAEVDMQCSLCKGENKECKVCSGTGWLEIGGCGMIHPNVFESVHLDSEVYTGYAFGFGLDRMAMLLFGLSDLRHMFEGDFAYQSQFPIYS